MFGSLGGARPIDHLSYDEANLNRRGVTDAAARAVGENRQQENSFFFLNYCLYAVGFAVCFALLLRPLFLFSRGLAGLLLYGPGMP